MRSGNAMPIKRICAVCGKNCHGKKDRPVCRECMLKEKRESSQFHSRYKYLSASERKDVCKKLKLKHVPVLSYSKIKDIASDVDSLLTYAEGNSLLNGSEREGLVFKNLDNPKFSFKTVSNKWLIKNKE